MRILIIILIMTICHSSSAEIIRRPFTSNDIMLDPAMDLASPPKGVTEIFIAVDSSTKINALHCEPKNAALPYLLYLHGNGETIWSRGMRQFIEIAKESGYGILAIDYEGYGKSEGTGTVANLLRDAEAGYDYITGKHHEAKIVIWGRSLGTIPAILLGTRHETDVVVLEGTISNLEHLEKPIEKLYSTATDTVDLQIIDDHAFDNTESIRKLRNPTLMIHGDQDDLALYDVAAAVYETMPSKNKEFFVLKGEGHNYGSTRIVRDVFKRVDACIGTFGLKCK